METDNNCVEATITGTLSCIDRDGSRPMTDDEFTEIIFAIADHLDDVPDITDPGVWGQSSTGDMKVHFFVPDSVPVLDGKIVDIIGKMMDAVGLIWAKDPRPPVRDDISVKMFDATSHHLDRV